MTEDGNEPLEISMEAILSHELTASKTSMSIPSTDNVNATLKSDVLDDGRLIEI